MRAVPARGEVEVVMPTIGGNEREVSHGVPGKSEPWPPADRAHCTRAPWQGQHNSESLHW
jgi:hypothetical protein